VWADNETDVDLLGFEFLVDGLVVALTQPRLLPLTVGVLGDWGSGKSADYERGYRPGIRGVDSHRRRRSRDRESDVRRR
jgi:hypothetical protein